MPSKIVNFSRALPRPIVMQLDAFIALAGSVLQGLDVDNIDAPPRVLDHARLLQRVRHWAYARSLYSQHLREKLLREMQIVASCQIAGTKQPTTKPSLSIMRCHASYRLLRLCVHNLLVADQRR